jgi:thiol-disulfide isomerase/thioredoxin
MAAPLQIPVPELSYDLTKLKTPIPAPAFELPDMDNEIHTLDQYKGKVIMLNFWATWCPPCRREMPSMQVLSQEFKDHPFTVIAINEWESEEIVFAFLGQLDLFPTFPILFDKSGDLSKKYKVMGLPTTFIINKQGEIVYRAIGGRDFNHPEVRKILLQLM